MIGISAILTKCQWLPFKWDLQKAKFALALPLSKGTPFITKLCDENFNVAHHAKMDLNKT